MIGTKDQQDAEAVIFEDSMLLNCLQRVIQSKSGNLAHTSGIPDFTRLPDYLATQGLPSSPTQTIARFKDKPLDFQPGEKFSYRYPNDRVVVIALGNREDVDTSRICVQLAKIVFGEK